MLLVADHGPAPDRVSTVPAAGTNERRCIYGALNYAMGQVHYLVHPQKNAYRFADFLGQLLAQNRQRFLVLVLDHASYHTTREVLDLLTEHEDHTFVVWLPKYGPKLNAIEGLWEYLKRSALNNYFYGSAEGLEQAVHETLKELGQHPETALSLRYDTLHKLRKTA